MSPEQARGEAIDHRSDLFALGVILYKMIAGDRPFKGATAADRVSAMLRDDPAPLPHASSEVPDNLDRIIRHSLEKVPDRRFQSASDFIFDLETLPATTLKAAANAGDRLRRRPTTRTVLLAASILTAGAVAAWLYTTGSRAPGSARRPAATARVTPFLASEALEDHPAWSPTGNLMVYVSDAAGSADVWIRDPSGTNPINLTATFPGTDSMPAWSPDGQRLAFYSDRDGGGIYTMNALGGDVRRVIPIKPGVLYTFSLAWSRDNSLVYTNFHDQGKKDVFRIAPSGAPASCLTCGLSSERGARSGELSPSGELLLYKTGEMGARGALQILHLASRRVVHVFDQVDRPRWSADGRRVIFISGQDGTPDLWQIEIDPATGNPAGEPERLTSGLAVTSFAIAPGDQQILAVTQKSHGNLWTFPGSAERVTDLAAGERWTTGQFLDTRGRWLPDGGGVVFQSNRRGSLDIWALASPTGQLSRLTSGAGAEHRPRVAPDGQWIAFDVIDGAGEYVHIMRRDGSGVRLPDDGWRQRFSMTCCAAWSPDGTRLAMHINASGTAIVRINPTSGAAIETTEIDLPGQADEYH